ncbi:hypothetical protein WG66_007960 [Moniliophthora roreri]|nr:hypothetical protein WG66_007960 [Moniliophthora roreri]
MKKIRRSENTCKFRRLEDHMESILDHNLGVLANTEIVPRYRRVAVVLYGSSRRLRSANHLISNLPSVRITVPYE